MNDHPKGSKEHAAAELGIDPSDVVSARSDPEQGCVFAVTKIGQKVKLIDGHPPEVLTGPGSEAEGDAATVEAPAVPLPAEEPDDLPPLMEDEQGEDAGLTSPQPDGGSGANPDHFEVFRGEDGQFYIRRMSGNGEEVAVSEGHKRRKDAVDEAEREAGDPDLASIV
jgi:hypothetical protein